MNIKLSVSKWTTKNRTFSLIGLIVAAFLWISSIWLGKILLSLAIIAVGVAWFNDIGILFANRYVDNKKDYFALIILVISLLIYGLSLYLGIRLFVITTVKYIV